MHLPTDHIDKRKLAVIVTWFIILLMVTVGFDYVVRFVVFIVMKLYELFVQRKAV